MFAATLRWYVHFGALQHLQQGLLHTFTGHIAGDRWVIGLPADLIDLIDIDDTFSAAATS